MLAARRTAQALLALTALSLAACSGEKTPSASQPAVPGTPTLASLQVLPASAVTLPITNTVGFQLGALGTYSDGSTRDLTGEVVWSSADPNVATVSSAAETAGLVNAVAIGTTAVVASDPATGVEASAAVEVVDTVVSVDVAPADPTILVGTTVQLQASATLVDYSVVDLAGQVTWASSDPAIATVSETGLVTAVALGAATVTATSAWGEQATTTVTVTDVPAALAYLSLSRGSVVGGNPVVGTVVLTSYAVDPVVVTLSSSNDALVTIDPVTVTIAAGSARASFDVTTLAVDRRTKVKLSATDGTVTKTASLNLRVQKR